MESMRTCFKKITVDPHIDIKKVHFMNRSVTRSIETSRIRKQLTIDLNSSGQLNGIIANGTWVAVNLLHVSLRYCGWVRGQKLSFGL
jgi:hypothetical protein